MASGKSLYLIEKLMKEQFHGEDFAVPTSLFLRLFTTVLTVAGVGTEVSGAGYTPVELACDDTVWEFTAPDNMENIDQIAVGVAGASWGTIQSWGLWDADTAGNLFWLGVISPGIEVLEGAVMVIPAGMLSLTEENEA